MGCKHIAHRRSDKSYGCNERNVSNAAKIANIRGYNHYRLGRIKFETSQMFYTDYS